MFACTKGHPVSAFIHKALIEYFEKHDYLADYWLTDYVIAIMYTESPTLRKYIDDLPLDNPTCLALLLERDKPFEKNRFYEIITTNRRLAHTGPQSYYVGTSTKLTDKQ